nr:MAG TPA: hypothetical protein [Caudoviricetes sp.]
MTNQAYGCIIVSELRKRTKQGQPPLGARVATLNACTFSTEYWAHKPVA